MKKSMLLVAMLTMFAAAVFAANCDPIDETWLKSGQSDLGEMVTDNDIWRYDTSYGLAKASRSGGVTAWLMTPAQDLTNVEMVNFSFSHTHKYAGVPSEELTLWMTSNYTGDPNTTTWQQLTISPYATNDNWTFVNVALNIPASKCGSKTVFGFKYTSTASNYATWEIKNVHLTATFNCEREGLRVCGQNLLNYYYNYATSSRPKYHDDAGLADKTHKIMAGIFAVNADIYAFCELEAKPIILKQLVDSLNKSVGKTRFAYVEDGIDEDPDSYDNNLKSGFIYRVDRAKPIGSSTAASTAWYYKNTMRIQTFEDLASGERFVLSMNHFKAKDSSSDQGNQSRVNNANWLISALSNVTADPDILVLGDLNCTIDEEPLQLLVSAGYAEQLVRFDGDTWSHCYSGSPELIDHVLANASMAKQIVDAEVKHICTTCNGNGGNSSTSYSDHDPYIVDLMLSPGECEDVDVTYLQLGGSGLAGMSNPQVEEGIYNKWYYDSRYGAVCSSNGNAHWLTTPSYNLSGAKSASVKFEHTINFAVDMTSQQTMWVTPDYKDIAHSAWTQLTIPTYPAGNNWTFVETEVTIPSSLLGKHTVIAFKNDVPSEAGSTPKWEIKNLHVKASCDGITSIVDAAENNAPSAVRLIENGCLVIILPDGSKYDMRGVRLQ